MKKQINANLVESLGDHVQLKFGNDFGYYSKHVNEIALHYFCEHFNSNSKSKKQGYSISCHILPNYTYVLYATNQLLDFEVMVKLLDHSVFIVANKEEWNKIHLSFFNELNKFWIKCLKENLDGYAEHYEKLTTLTQTSCYI